VARLGLAALLSLGSLASLTHLILGLNEIGDAGMIAFASAMGTSGSLANLRDLYLGGNNISDRVKDTMKTAAKARNISVHV